MEELKEASVIERAMGEIRHHWEPTNAGNRTLEYKGVTELCLFLVNCGIEIDQENRYELLLTLRSSEFKEKLQDNEVKFLMWQ